MSEASRISDADLMAYLDRALDPDARARMEALLAGDADAQARLSAWRRQNDLIAGLYEPVLAEPLPARLDPRRMAAARPAAVQVWMRMAATVALCLALGAGGGWYWGQRGATGNAGGVAVAMDEALAAHRLYAADILHPVEVWGNADGHLGGWLSKRLGRTLAIPDLAQEGWTLMGGSLLPAGGTAAAQIMYEDGAGRRLTLFLTPGGGASEGDEPRYAEAGSLNALRWSDARLDCTIVGTVGRAEMKRIAAAVYEQLS